jgi:hypothetical protein
LEGSILQRLRILIGQPFVRTPKHICVGGKQILKILKKTNKKTNKKNNKKNQQKITSKTNAREEKILT